MKETNLPTEIAELFDTLPPSDQRCLYNILEGNTLWVPQSTPQFLAVISQADELLFGGQAGGGKSDLVLGLSLIAHEHSIVFRREYKQLVGATGLIARSHEIIGPNGRFNGQESTWRNLPGDRTLEFGSCQYERDVLKYRGRPHDFIAFDELSEFTEYQYRFLLAWARTTSPGQRVRVVGGSNPPTHIEGQWVVAYWGPWLDSKHPNPAKPGELRYFVVLDGKDVEVSGPESIEHNGEVITPKSRTFIPASLADNIFLGDEYVQQLQGLPEPYRSQLLYGDFTIGLEDHPWQVIPTEWVILAQERWKNRKRPDVPLTALGVDVARGGEDTTAIAPCYDNWFDEVIEYPGSATPDGQTVAALVVEELGKRGIIKEEDRYNTTPPINIDIISIGSSPYDVLSDWGADVFPINAGAGSNARDRTGLLKMRNVRAELWWGMREALDPKQGDDIALPDDPQLLADLCTPRWKPTTSGIQIESKEDIKKRLGRSTNKGDAVVMARMSEPMMLW